MRQRSTLLTGAGDHSGAVRSSHQSASEDRATLAPNCGVTRCKGDGLLTWVAGDGTVCGAGVSHDSGAAPVRRLHWRVVHLLSVLGLVLLAAQRLLGAGHGASRR